jgi:hypothetical protein
MKIETVIKVLKRYEKGLRNMARDNPEDRGLYEFDANVFKQTICMIEKERSNT